MITSHSSIPGSRDEKTGDEVLSQTAKETKRMLEGTKRKCSHTEPYLKMLIRLLMLVLMLLLAA